MNIGGYELTTDFTTAGGGRCKWAFAKRDGTEYFIKCFLSPKQYVPGKSAGGKATRDWRNAACNAFEDRQSRILSALDGKTGLGGNLIAPLDFFSFDGCYYKVTEKIIDRGIKLPNVGRLPMATQLMILRSAAGAVRVLHSVGLVHGDIKIDNIIIRERDHSTMTASVIDFDDSYFVGNPPVPPEDFTFDPPYAAPEVFRYVADRNSRTAMSLTTAADVFSLGIVFCEYLVGDKPQPVGSRYLGEALLSGGSIKLPSPAGTSAAMDVIRSMLALDPNKRPPLKEVLDRLASGRSTSATTTTTSEAERPRLVMKMRTASDAKTMPASTSPAPSPPIGGSQLRGTLARKSDK